MKLLLKLFPAFILLALLSCGGNKEQTDTVVPATDSMPANLADITKKIEADPKNAALYDQRAQIYLESKDPGKALSDINKAIELDAKNPAWYRTLSDVYFSMGKAQKCREALNKALTMNEDDTEALLKLAELDFYFKDYEKCFEETNRALKIDEMLPRAYFIKGMAYREMGDTAKAVKNLQIAVEKDQQYFDAYMQLGLIFSTKHNPLAADYFRNALNVNPKSIEAYYGLGMYYQSVGEFNKAIESYSSILKIDPKYKYAHFNLGYIHLVYLKVYDVAIRHFTDAITADPNYAEAYYNRGYSYELRGDVNNARTDYKQAMKIKPNYTKAVEGMNRLDKGSK